MSLYGQGTLLIFKVLTENLGVSIFADNNIDIDQFHNSTDKKLFEHILQHQKEYSKLPDIKTIKKSFPELREVLIPQEPLSFFVDLFFTSYKRYVLEVMSKGIADGINHDQDLDLIIADVLEANAMLSKNSNRKEIASTLTLSQAISQAVEAARKRRQQGTEISGVSFGFDFIDKVTDGAQGGDFITIAARPKAGKTHILCNAANAAYDQGKRVMIATFEMKAIQLARRILERRTNMSSKSMKFGQLTTRSEKRILKHIEELKAFEAEGKSFTIYHGSLFTTVDKLAAKISEINPDVLFVDGAYLLKLSRGSRGLWETVSESASFLKDVALTRNIPVIATYQLNREGVGKKGGADNMMYSDTMSQLASLAFILKKVEEGTSGEATTWGSSLKRILKIDRDRDGESAEVEVELSFGKKPFAVTKVIQGDLSHIGYGKAEEEEYINDRPFGGCLGGFSTAK